MSSNLVTKCELSQNAQKFCHEIGVVTKCVEILLRNARCYKVLALLHNVQLLQNAP